jgi:hypothetical protein
MQTEAALDSARGSEDFAIMCEKSGVDLERSLREALATKGARRESCDNIFCRFGCLEEAVQAAVGNSPEIRGAHHEPGIVRRC